MADTTQPSAPSAMKATCPTCAAASPLGFRTIDRNRRLGSTRFSYYACPACGTIFLSPVPADLGPHYPPDYYCIPASLAELTRCAEVDRHKLGVLNQFSAPGRLLEIGPAYGYFAFLAKQAGFTVEAIEMDDRCSAFLRDTVGIPVAHTADTASALRTLGEFDVIALWHVIEHLPDPWPTLAAAAGSLRPGGILIIAAPNPEAFQFRVLRGRWTHVDAPRHVQLIPRGLLRRKLESGGLVQVHATTTDEAARGWDRFGWEMSLLGIPPRHHRLRRVLAPLVRLLAILMIPFDRRPGRGSAYTLVFRRASA